MPRLLDLYCGAGGAAAGYARLGFDVVGVDHRRQPSYPFEFVLADALAFLSYLVETGNEEGFAAVHASPPCQGYGAATRYLVTRETPLLIAPTRALLDELGLPYVIENVHGAPLRDPVLVCGSMVGLDVKRHRLFECSGFDVVPRPTCQHDRWQNRYPTNARKRNVRVPTRKAMKGKAQTSPVVHVYGTGSGVGKQLDLWRRAMEVPWMRTKAEVAEAIPPAYTELIGAPLLQSLTAAAA